MQILVLYASRHGHTRRVAEAIAAAASARGLVPDLRDVESAPPDRLDGYGAAVLASPVHVGRHAKRMVAFVRRHLPELDARPNAFVSVSLTQATVESTTADLETRRQADADLCVVMGHFVESTGWTPGAVLRVAGALSYTRYNWFVRWVIKRIAKRQGGSTDTSRDHVLTNWEAVERFASRFFAGLDRREAGVRLSP